MSSLEIPEVSIIIATYGDEEWGQRAFDHAYPSAEEASRRGFNLDEIVVRHLPNGTLAQARNTAAAFATKQWLCFLDADDQLDPEYVLAMEGPMWHASHYWQPTLMLDGGTWNDKPPMSLLAPAVSYVTEQGVRGAAAIPNEGRWPDLNECVIGTLIPRFMFQAVGGFRELPIYEDWDLFLRCVKRGAEIRHVGEAVYLATVNADSRNQGPLARETYDRVRAEHAELFV